MSLFWKRWRLALSACAVSLGVFLIGTAVILADGETTDSALHRLLEEQHVTPLTIQSDFSPELVQLGQALFFDKELSGNRDISCATCHHPLLATGDALSLSFGTGNHGLGPTRTLAPERNLIPRNAPDLFNRGAEEWRFMFWDGRIELADDGSLITPAKEQTPPGLLNLLAAQAIFPITSPDEMRGSLGDTDINGHTNELAGMPPNGFAMIWQNVMARLMAIPAYRQMFQAAFPGRSDFGIQDMGNAIAAFEIQAYTFTNNPWNRYVAGDESALSEEAKQGALLFYGEAGCSTCHSGALLSDQQFHNRVIPQLGPGKGAGTPFDYGRMLETGEGGDLFAFRTPSLYNVALTGPWMHNGAMTTLEETVRHELNPEVSCANYDPTPLLPVVRQSVLNMDVTQLTLGEDMGHVDLTDAQVGYLLAFMESLTDPAALTLADTIPLSVPSGLPIAD